VRVLISLIEAMSVFLVASYVFCASVPGLPLRREKRAGSVRTRISLYLFFTAVSVMGT